MSTDLMLPVKQQLLLAPVAKNEKLNTLQSYYMKGIYFSLESKKCKTWCAKLQLGFSRRTLVGFLQDRLFVMGQVCFSNDHIFCLFTSAAKVALIQLESSQLVLIVTMDSKSDNMQMSCCRTKPQGEDVSPSNFDIWLIGMYA